MKKISAFFATGILVLFLSSQTGASDFSDVTESGKAASFMEEAIKHAETAKKHKAHADHIHEHAKMSLEYVKSAEIEAIELGYTSKEREPITESIQHLVEAIRHARKGYTLIANEHIAKALTEMHQFTNE